MLDTVVLRCHRRSKSTGTHSQHASLFGVHRSYRVARPTHIGSRQFSRVVNRHSREYVRRALEDERKRKTEDKVDGGCCGQRFENGGTEKKDGG